MTIEEAFAELKRLYPKHQKIEAWQWIERGGSSLGVKIEGEQVFEDSFEECFTAIAPKIKTPDQIAADKRTQAAALLAEADALEGKATP
jgi:hypothetical protein